MKGSSRLALMVGLLVALTAVSVHLLGGFVTWERRSIDFRFRHLPRPPDPMSSEIVHVDIDDGALASQGRWPWDRSKLADVINVLQKAGAKTIALDVLLSEEQQYPSGTERTIDHDERFAEALGRTQSVLAVEVRGGSSFHELWMTERGSAERERLLDVLGRDIQLENVEALERARVTGLRRARYERHPLRFKTAAAWRALNDRGPFDSFEAFEQAVAGEPDEFIADYPERLRLESVWRQHEAWRLVGDCLLPGRSKGSYDDSAPLPSFAAQANAVGFVTISGQEHADDVVREVETRLDGPGGGVLQFGLAAAALHMGIKPDQIEIRDDRLVIGPRTLPLRDGRLWIRWPTSATEPRWEGLLRQNADDSSTEGHLTIGAIASLSAERRKHAENERKFATLTSVVLAQQHRRGMRSDIGDLLSAAALETARGEAEFFLDVEPGAVSTPELIAEVRQSILDDDFLNAMEREAELRQLEACVRWFTVSLQLNTGGSDLSLRDRRRLENDLAQTTLDLLVYADPFTPPVDLLGGDVRDLTREVARSVLSEAELDDGKTGTGDINSGQSELQDHRHNCALWRRADMVVTEGAKRMSEVEAKIRRLVEGRLVFVGWTATGTIADFVPTAIDGETPGVVVHAAIANMVLQGRGMRFLPPWLEGVIVLLMGGLCALVAARLPPLPSAVFAGVVLAVYSGVAGIWLFNSAETILPIIAPVSGGMATWVTGTVVQATVTLRERRRISRQFRARVSAQLVDHLTANPDEVSMSGEERVLTVMFGDLAGFTAISEALGGPTTVSTLNSYMNGLTNVLIEHDAYVNKFLGDGFMAFWSAFAHDPDQAAKACDAALECQRVVRRLNNDPQLNHVPDLGLRIGVATGRVIVGDCGAPPRLNDYTVIGNGVNLASRLESANKQFGTWILINDRTRLELDPELHVTRPIGRIIVMGQTVPVAVHELLPDDADPTIIDLTARAVAAFEEGRLKQSATLWGELTKRCGPNPLAEFYTDVIRHPDRIVDGAVRLDTK